MIFTIQIGVHSSMSQEKILTVEKKATESNLSQMETSNKSEESFMSKYLYKSTGRRKRFREAIGNWWDSFLTEKTGNNAEQSVALQTIQENSNHVSHANENKDDTTRPHGKTFVPFALLFTAVVAVASIVIERQ
jgi:hypothetical protein